MSETLRPSKPKRLFPMHLTPFENYMLLDDRREYPMTFFVQLDFHGEIVLERFERSLERTLERHPLLQAIVQPAKQNRDCWVSAKGKKPPVDFGPLDKPIDSPGGDFINLRDEVGLKIWVRKDSSQTLVTFLFHHAVTDGIGSYQFIGDLLYFYAVDSGEQFDQELPLVNQSNLRNRLKSSFPVERFIDSKGKFKFEWRETTKMLMGRVASLKKLRNGTHGSQHRTFPGIQSHTFEKDAYRQLRLKAQEFGQTPNDLLLEKLFVTLRQWNKNNGLSIFPGKYCVLIPLDLRDQNTPEFSATNVVTYTFIRRPDNIVRDHKKLADTLRVETTMLKNNRHSTSFMNMLAGSFRYRKTMDFILSGKSLATAVMSNTGDPTRHFNVQLPKDKGVVRCGDLMLETISGTPPMRKNTRLTISAFTYRRVLKICLRCDPHYFSDEDAQAFLELYVTKLTES